MSSIIRLSWWEFHTPARPPRRRDARRHTRRIPDQAHWLQSIRVGSRQR